ncbi:MAG: HAD family hydrolase [Rhodobacteraceae bacterium]|nr:HAD family hydrolase [Paracoccaceae bacterium]
MPISAPTSAPISGLLFDKDGTLFDFGATWEGWAKAFLLRICTNDRARATALGWHIGFDLANRRFQSDSIVIADTPAGIAQAMIPHLPETTYDQLLETLNNEAEQVSQIEVVPLVPYLEKLRSTGLRLGVATNDAISPALVHLDSVGIRGHFDFIAGSDSGFGAKPAPGQLLGFARAVDLDPGVIAMVGDSAHDLVAGRAAGMVTIGVLTGYASESDLAPHADVVLPDIGHIPGWIVGK